MTDQKRPTVTVTSGLVQSLVMHLYKPIDFGKGPVQARLIDEPVTLKPGSNAGIDKAFFEAWKAQNEHLTVMPLITALDEPESGEQTQGAASAAPGGAKSMDHDAQARHVQNLIKFRERAEKVLDWAEARMKAESAAPEPGHDPAAATGAVTAQDLEQLRAELAEMGEHVTVIQQGHDAVVRLFEDVTVMRDWFAENRAALETVLAMGEPQPGDEVDQANQGSASTVGPDLSGSTSTSTAGPDLAGAGGSMISGADLGTGLSPAAGGPGGQDVANMADAAARGGAGAPAAEVGSEAPAPDGASPGAALTASEVMKDPTADPVKVGE